MTKDKEIRMVVPALRFPEFRDAEGWEEITIGSIGEVITGNTPSKSEDEYWNGNFMWVTAQDFTNKYIEKSMLRLTDKGKLKTRVLPKNSILVTCIASIGLNGINQIECATNQQINSIICYRNYYYEFIYYAISYNNGRLRNLAGQTAIPIISKSIFENFSIFISKNYSEQTKIADCLSSLDGLICAVADKIEALKEYKKGLMQQLFPAEGKTTPTLRFPKFQNAGEWRAVSLGDIATFINGRAYKQDELLESGKYRVLRVGNFFSNTNWYYSDLELDENKYCDKGDLLYAWSASFGPKVWNEDKVIFHYHIWKVIEHKDISKDFLLILLDCETERIKTQQANGLGLLHITKGAIEGWKTRIPKNISEQQKIADCLLSVDELISAETNKFAQLKAHKKGLMQQLFPSINE